MVNRWDKTFSEGVDFKEINEIILDQLLKKSEEYLKRKPRTVVDLGCGTGDALVKFAQRKMKVIGIDASSVAIEKAQVRIAASNAQNIELKLLNLDEISALQIQVDIVFCRLVYAFIENKEVFLENVKKLIGEDGLFILITPVLYKDIQYTPKDKPGIAVDAEEVEKLLKKKFAQVEIFNHDYFGEKGDAVTFIASR